ncbi:hypothetical protein D8674_036865 [Pyrus ussuriensis x Pyrus communis]|uniref:Uncharacterized protein n=1 Tax=Pyrus ussuriensis x Pyrus communis TaxID=2448454 RepID=A0A5N5G9P9_9ROSA|nr:hypothetical protein D8674_036865 [Pyrus ussuriensis x Pyrus communis]
MKAEPITTTKYAKRRNCIWRTTRNPLVNTVVGKFVKDGCYLKIHLKKDLVLQTRAKNPFPGEASIPRATRRNKAQKLKEKGKAKDDYAFQQEMASPLRLMAEQNTFATEERNCRHKEWAKQIQEKHILIRKRGKLWPDGSCLHPTILLQCWMKMMIIVFKLKLVWSLLFKM